MGKKAEQECLCHLMAI